MGVLPSPLAGSLLVGAAWLLVAVAGLIPAANAAFARRSAFPLGAPAGVALAALGLQAVWLPAQTLTLPLGLPDLPFHVRMDPRGILPDAARLGLGRNFRVRRRLLPRRALGTSDAHQH